MRSYLIVLLLLFSIPSSASAARFTATKQSVRQTKELTSAKEQQHSQNLTQKRSSLVKELRFSELKELHWYTDSSYPLTFEYPFTWGQNVIAPVTGAQKKMGRVYSKNGNGDLMSGHAVFFDFAKEGRSDDELWDIALRQFGLQDLGLKGTVSTAQKFSALEARYDSSDETKEQGWVVMIPTKGKTAYAFLFRARNSKGFKGNEDAFKHILQTFKPLPAN